MKNQFRHFFVAKTTQSKLHRDIQIIFDTPTVDFINVLRVPFAPIFLCQKLQSQNVTREKLRKKNWFDLWFRQTKWYNYFQVTFDHSRGECQFLETSGALSKISFILKPNHNVSLVKSSKLLEMSKFIPSFFTFKLSFVWWRKLGIKFKLLLI